VNIIDGFLLHAKHQPTVAAICAPGWNYNIVSYGRLLVFANNAAAHALAAGLKRGDVVGILARDPIFHWALVLGLTQVGIVSFSLHDANVPAGFRIDAVLSETPISSKISSRFIRIDQSWVEGAGRALEPGPEHDKDAVARIILTSGTTGDQKAVALSHDLIWRRIQTYDFAFGNQFPACSRIFVDVGIAANSGYLWPIYILSRGGTVFVRGSDPAETMQALSLYGVQGMVAPPSGMAEFLDYYEQSPAFLCPFDVMLSVGSKLATSLSDRVRARMCPNVVHGYGATEGNPVAGAYVHQTAHIKGAVGYITPGMIVQAVDDGAGTLQRIDDAEFVLGVHPRVHGHIGRQARQRPRVTRLGRRDPKRCEQVARRARLEPEAAAEAQGVEDLGALETAAHVRAAGLGAQGLGMEGLGLQVRAELRDGDELLAEADGTFLHVPLEHFLATPEGRAAGEAWARRLDAGADDSNG